MPKSYFWVRNNFTVKKKIIFLQKSQKSGYLQFMHSWYEWYIRQR